MKKSVSSAQIRCRSVGVFVISLLLITGAFSALSAQEKTPFIPKKIRLDDDTKMSHTLVGGYYNLKNGMKSRLLLNNKGGHPLEVKPTLYALNGEALKIPAITIEPNKGTFIDLSEWASLGSEAFLEGNLRLVHRGNFLVLGSQIHLTDEQNSLGFEYKLRELKDFNSKKLEGVWWSPSGQAETAIVLTNTRSKPLAVTVTLTRKPAVLSNPAIINLLPHETKILDIARDFENGETFANKKILGMSISHEGRKDALLARGMVKDTSSGYSNTIVFTRIKDAGSKQYHGAGLQLGGTGEDKLRPIVIVRNVSDQESTVKVRVPYTTEKGNQKKVKLQPIILAPKEIRRVDMQEVKDLKNVKVAGLEIKHTGKKGSVVASAQSVSRDGNQVFRTLLWDMLEQQSATGGYPFYIEGTSKSMAYIKNGTDREQPYYAYLIYGDRQTYLIKSGNLLPHETVKIDVKKLRDEQTPDVLGKKLPADLIEGQIQWSAHTNVPTKDVAIPDRQSLVGQMIQFDIEKGINSTYFCQTCCTGSSLAGAILPLVPTISEGATTTFLAFDEQLSGCSSGAPPILVPVNNATWSVANSSVASINQSGVATGQGSGTTLVSMSFPASLKYYNPCGGGGGGGEPLEFVKTTLVSRIVSYFFGEDDENCIDGVRQHGPNASEGKEISDSSNLTLPCDTCVSTPITSGGTTLLTVTAPQMVIKRDGQPITSSNNTVSVGERVTLTAEVVPSGASVSNHSWVLPGITIGDYNATKQTASVVAVSGLSTNATNFVWVDAGNNRKITYSATVNGQSVTAEAFINVTRPTTINTTSAADTTSGIFPGGVHEIHLGTGPNPGTPGISFVRGNTTQPASGSFQWVQTVDSFNFTATLLNGDPVQTPSGVMGLDGKYPYASATNTTDSPGIGTAAYKTSMAMDISYTMHLMFKPNGNDSEWVPIRKVAWRWKWTAVESNGQWTVTPIIEPPATLADSDSTIHPTWSLFIVSGSRP